MVTINRNNKERRKKKKKGRCGEKKSRSIARKSTWSSELNEMDRWKILIDFVDRLLCDRNARTVLPTN